MNTTRFSLAVSLAIPLVLISLARAVAADAEEDFYRIITLPTPEGVVLETSGLDTMPNGKLAVSTRYGDIWLVDNALADPPDSVSYSLFASGLHEVLGIARYGEWLYACQRGEVTRMKDLDGDERADVFDTIADGWEISGDYHEYAFGSRFDSEGRMWITLCLTGSFTSNVLFRGWALTVSHDGVMTPVASGIRSPGGVGFNAEGDVFYTDNQGPWNGSCYLRQIKPGAFMGHPASIRWYDNAPNLGKAPREPKSGSRIHVEKQLIPELMPPAVIFPYNKMGQSASGVLCDRSGGRFGPFDGQLFVSDQTHSTVMRVFLEKIDGSYQGVCFPFRKGFRSGNIAMYQAADGSMFVGGSNRGWGARGGKPFGLERLVWTGEAPFEVHQMRATKDGFELRFTKPVDRESAARVESYDLKTYTYICQSSYGSPEVDHTTPKITRVAVGDDSMRVRLVVDGIQIGHVHELRMKGLRSTDDRPLLHDVAYYTLFKRPE